MKEGSHKNSLVLTRKLAPKEEEWNSLQRGVNFETSWNFVFKKELHCSTLDYITSFTLTSSQARLASPPFGASNSGDFVRFKGPKVLEKRYFTMKERSHKNSLVLTRKLAPKEEEWNSLQRAVNFQTSWNFVFKKYLHCCTLDSILIYEKERVWNCLCTHYFHFFAALFAI